MATVGLGAALLVTGPVSEVLGRTRLIHVSLMASGVLALACALAPSWDVLLALRLAQGVTLAGLPAVATAYLREEIHPGTYARAAGQYIGGTALGGLTGRLVTSAVADAAGWRWALAAIAAVGLVCAAIVFFALPPSRNFTPAPIGPGQLMSMTRRAVSDPGLLALYAIGACSMGAFVAVFNAIGFRLTSAPFYFSAGAVGLVFLIYPVGSLSAALAGRMADRFSRRTVVPASCLVSAAGLLLTLPGSPPAIVLGLAVMLAGFFGVHGVASGWVPARAHARRHPARAGRVPVPVRVLPRVLHLREPGRPRLDPGRLAGRCRPGAGTPGGQRTSRRLAAAHPVPAPERAGTGRALACDLTSA